MCHVQGMSQGDKGRRDCHPLHENCKVLRTRVAPAVAPRGSIESRLALRSQAAASTTLRLLLTPSR